MPDVRRVYYDHEPAYRRIAQSGGTGWDDLFPGQSCDSYRGLEAFLTSRECPIARPESVALDLGCGGGQAAILLSRAGFVVTAIDFSETAITLARANVLSAQARVSCRVGDCITLETEAEATYDLAIDNHLFHCLIGPDRTQFLASVWRVLRPGGIFFSESMCFSERLDLEAIGIHPETRISHSRTRYWATQSELEQAFVTQGFRLLSVERRQQDDVPNAGDVVAIVARKEVDVPGSETLDSGQT
jgi:SAM-dependent methyltransferase